MALPADPIKPQPQALQRYRILLGDFMLEDMEDQIGIPPSANAMRVYSLGLRDRRAPLSGFWASMAKA